MIKYGAIFLVGLSGLSGLSWAEAPASCVAFFPVWIVNGSDLHSYPGPAIASEVTESAKTGALVSSLAGTFTAVGVSEVAQNARITTALGLLACDDRLPPREGPLDWQDSPTRWALGSSDFGNWILYIGISGVSGIVAYRIGAAKMYFPGILVFPGLFLMPQTVTSSVTLMRQGDTAEQVLGTCSILGMLVGVSMAGAPSMPRFFQAQWESQPNAWVNIHPGSGFVEQYGKLFEKYRPQQQGYVTVELSNSIALGTLRSYQELQQDCGYLLWLSAAIYNLYALSQMAQHPNHDTPTQYFLSGIAAVQALALTTQAIAWAALSEETQEQVRAVTQWVVVITEYLMMAKTVFNVGLRLKGLYEARFVTKTLSESSAVSIVEPLLEASLAELPMDLLEMDEPVELRSMSSASTSSSSSRASDFVDFAPVAESVGLSGLEAYEISSNVNSIRYNLREEIVHALSNRDGYWDESNGAS